MQEMQPKISALREKYKSDRAEMNRQMMKLQQDEGFNPLSGCLPLFLQIPVFLGLFHVLRHLSNSVGAVPVQQHVEPPDALHVLQDRDVRRARARLFGAPLAASFHDSSSLITKLGGDPSTTRWVILVLLVISAAATAATQLLVRASATVPPEGTAATVQKLMLYVIPVGVLVSGLLFNFPLGVLLYWFTSNLWTLGQQAYILRFHPHTPKVAPETGTVGRTLAPKPGQRPQRGAVAKRDRLGGPAAADDEDEGTATAPGPPAPAPHDPGSAPPGRPVSGRRASARARPRNGGKSASSTRRPHDRWRNPDE